MVGKDISVLWQIILTFAQEGKRCEQVAWIEEQNKESLGTRKLVKDGTLTIQKAAVEAEMTVSEFEEKYI